MLEAYQALADYNDIADLMEVVFAGAAEAAVGQTTLEYQGRPVSLEPPFERVTMLELVSRFVGREVTLDDDPSQLESELATRGGSAPDGSSTAKLAFELYELAHREIWEPTFVLDFPREVSPLARTHRSDPRLTERFELVIAGSEYCNAFSELNDPDEQLRRFETQAAQRGLGDDEAHVIDYDYIASLTYGLPPTGGLGIGVDRLVMLLTDQSHIRDVILFPTMRPLSEGEEE
jgi:lysyl-tRNA synthetase class 2